MEKQRLTTLKNANESKKITDRQETFQSLFHEDMKEFVASGVLSRQMSDSTSTHSIEDVEIVDEDGQRSLEGFLQDVPEQDIAEETQDQSRETLKDESKEINSEDFSEQDIAEETPEDQSVENESDNVPITKEGKTQSSETTSEGIANRKNEDLEEISDDQSSEASSESFASAEESRPDEVDTTRPTDDAQINSKFGSNTGAP